MYPTACFYLHRGKQKEKESLLHSVRSMKEEESKSLTDEESKSLTPGCAQNFTPNTTLCIHVLYA